MEKYSQCGQDLIVLKYLKNKKNGYFLDIGCCLPKTINNTYLLEKNYGWNGISIDIHDFIEESDGSTWKKIRNSIHIVQDALEINYYDLLNKYNSPQTIDFLSMDLEPPTLTYEVLYKIPFDKYKFNFIAYEVDELIIGGEERKINSREYIISKDYYFLGSLGGQDDLYVHNDLIDIANNINFYETLRETGTPEHIILHFNKNII
jgi:hypothetical protein